MAEFDRRGRGACGCGETIQNWTSGIAEAEQLGDFVVGFTGSVVAGLADFAIPKLSRGFGASSLLRADFVEDGVAARNDEADGGKFRDDSGWVSLEKDRVDVALEVIDGNERFAQGLRESFGISDSHQERTNETWALCHAHGVDVGETEAGLGQCFADDWDDLAQVFARGKFRYDSAVFAMNIDLGSDDAREDLAAIGDDSRGGFVAGRLDAKDANAHESMLTQRFRAVRDGRTYLRRTHR